MSLKFSNHFLLSFFFLLLVNILHGQKADQHYADRNVKNEDLETIVGKWEGKLLVYVPEWDDFKSIRSNLVVKKGKNSKAIRCKYIYPGKELNNSLEKMLLSKDGKLINQNTILSNKIVDSGMREIVTEYIAGESDEIKAVQVIYTFDEQNFMIYKNLKYDLDGRYLPSNEFRYKRIK